MSNQKKTHNLLIGVAVSACVLTTVVAATSSLAESDAEEHAEKRNRSTVGDVATKEELSRLRAELAQVKHMNQAMARSVATELLDKDDYADSGQDEQRSAAETTESDRARPVVPYEEVVQRSLDKAHARSRFLRARLAEESRDEEWAPQVESAAAAFVSALDADHFPSTSIDSMSCGSTMCEMRVIFGTTEEADSFGEALELDTIGFASAVSEQGDVPGSLVTTIMLGREGQPLANQAQR